MLNYTHVNLKNRQQLELILLLTRDNHTIPKQNIVVSGKEKSINMLLS